MKTNKKINLILLRTFLCITLFLLINVSFAQYLKVNSTSYVYPEANRHTVPIEKMANGDLLELLLDGEQTNGYYYVKCKSYNQRECR